MELETNTTYMDIVTKAYPTFCHHPCRLSIFLLALCTAGANTYVITGALQDAGTGPVKR